MSWISIRAARQRASRTTTASTQPDLSGPRSADVPGSAVQRPCQLNVGETDYDALLCSSTSGFSKNYQRARVVHASPTRRQHRGNGARRSSFQVRERHAPRAERGADRLRSAATTSWSAAGARAAHRRPDVQLGGARAERLAVQPDQQPSTRIATARWPSRCAAGNYTGTGTIAAKLHGRRTTRQAQRRLGPGFFQLDMRFGYRARTSATAARSSCRPTLQRDQPHELRQPDRQPGGRRRSWC